MPYYSTMWRRLLLSALVAIALGAALAAQAPEVLLPTQVLHVFRPDASNYLPPSFLVADSVNSAIIGPGGGSVATNAFRRVAADGRVEVLHQVATDEGDVLAAIASPDGGILGIGRGPVDVNGGTPGFVFHLDAQGRRTIVYRFQGLEDGYSAEAIRRGEDGNVYVSARRGTRDVRMLVIHPDGTLEPNRYAVPGDVLAVRPDGTAYGLTCENSGQELFVRDANGVIATIATLSRFACLAGISLPGYRGDIAFGNGGALIGVGPFEPNGQCRLVRVSGAAVVVLHDFRPTPGFAVCASELRRGPSSGDVSGAVIRYSDLSAANGIIDHQVYRVSRDGLYRLFATLPPSAGTPIDLVVLADGRTWLWLQNGGIYRNDCASGGSGILEVSANGTTQRLVTSFSQGLPDGSLPGGPMVVDDDGSVYGTTGYGGNYNAGVVYRVGPAGDYAPIYTFSCAGDGGIPSGLVKGRDGALYGSTFGFSHFGTVFRIGRTGNLTTLLQFRRTENGVIPNPPVVGRDGRLYGTTQAGGANGRGVAFAMTPTGDFTVLHHFSTADGIAGTPIGQLLAADDGSFYGIAMLCSADGCSDQVIYRLTAYGDVTIVYRSRCGSGGPTGYPTALAQGADRRLYARDCDGLFALTFDGQVTRSSVFPAAILASRDGSVYGAGGAGGAADFFRLTAPNTVTRYSLSPRAVDDTVVLADGPLDRVYGLGLHYFTVNNSQSLEYVLYRVNRPGPGAPTGIRIVR